ncbi:hypothetical protein EV361DRAFT_967680, partial [Lentinula raphanica]
MPPSTKFTCRKLSLLFHLVLNNPQLLTPREVIDSEGNTFDQVPILLTQLRRYNVPPFWEETCPPEFQAKWGEDWEEIHDKIDTLFRTGGRMELEKVNYKANGLEALREGHKDEAWGSCMDGPVLEYLAETGFTVRERYTAWAQYSAKRSENGEIGKGFVGLGSWSGRVDQTLEAIFGDAVKTFDVSPTEEARVWYLGLIQSFIDSGYKVFKRAQDTIAANQKALENLLGTAFWETLEPPQKFEIKVARQILKKLENWKSQLSWQVLLLTDQAIRDEELDIESVDAPKLIADRFQRLSDN